MEKRPVFKQRLPEFLDNDTNTYLPSSLNSEHKTMPKAVIRNPQQKLKSNVMKQNNNGANNDRTLYKTMQGYPPQPEHTYPSPLHKSMSLPFPRDSSNVHEQSPTSPSFSDTPQTAPNAGHRNEVI